MRVQIKEPNGTPNPYAARVHARVMADAFYLGRQREFGHEQAAEETCKLFEHDARGGRCERCGRGVSAGEARERKQATGQARS